MTQVGVYTKTVKEMEFYLLFEMKKYDHRFEIP